MKYDYDPNTDVFRFPGPDGEYVGVPVGTTDREDQKNPTVYLVRSPDGDCLGWYREAPMCMAVMEHRATGRVDSAKELDYRVHYRDGFTLLP